MRGGVGALPVGEEAQQGAIALALEHPPHSLHLHEIDPDQNLLSQEAYVRTLTGDPDVAITLLKQYVAANPKHEFLQNQGTSWWWRELRTNPRWREIGHVGR